jgi:DNA-binding NarL/FixJ family response regulator
MLAISANAVKKHVSRLLELLEASNRTELASQLARRAA